MDRHLELTAPQCTICIANYNGEAMLADCLDSVLNQDSEVSLEIIVHDDASTDGSLRLLHGRYPQVAVIASAQNVGFCVANNRMVDQAKGKFILLLNNDASLHHDALRTLMRASAGQQGIWTLPQYDWNSGDLVDRGCLLDPFYNPVPNTDAMRVEVAMVIGACLWITRDTWSQLGGFPEWFESIGEDLYLCCLARRRGMGVYCASASGYRHRRGMSFSGPRHSGNALVTTHRRRRLSERNKAYTLFVATPGWALAPLLAALFISLAAEAIVLALSHRSLSLVGQIYLNVPLSMLRHWRTLIRARRTLRSQSESNTGAYWNAFQLAPYKLAALLKHGLPSIRD